MKVYEIKLKEGEEHFTTALVKDAAVETKLLYFNADDEKPQLFFNDEKRVVYSVAMRPNKEIFRKNINGEPAKVFYTEETVEKFQQNYFKFQGQNKTNVGHSDEPIKDVYPVESWIVADAENDKSNVIGLQTMKGDLVMAFKVENDEVWKQCKEGEIDGLSIEAYFDNFEINKKDEKMSKLNFWDSIKNTIKKFAEENEGLKVAIGEKSYSVTALEVGGLVTDESGEPLADGEFEFEGKKYSTDNLGAIKEVEEIEAMAEDEPKEDEAPKEEEKVEEMEGEDVEAFKSEIEKLKSDKLALETELADMKAAKVEAETKLETMKKQTPKATVISRNPIVKMSEDKPQGELTNYEKYLANRGKL